MRGRLIGTNVLLFESVAIDTDVGVRSKIFTITNIRANAGAIGSVGPITAAVKVDDVLVRQPANVIGLIRRGLIFEVRTADSSAPLSGKPLCLKQSAAYGQRIATLRFSEGFDDAFKPRAGSLRAERVIPFSTSAENCRIRIGESGPFNVAFNDSTGAVSVCGLADFGTRLVAVFNNVPAGVMIFVSRNAKSNSSDEIVAMLTQSDIGSFSAVQATGVIEGESVTQLTLTNGTGIAVWEIMRRDRDGTTWLEFSVYVRFESNPAVNSPALGTATVTGDFAPGTTVISASPSHPVPRFQRLSGVAPLFTISR